MKRNRLFVQDVPRPEGGARARGVSVASNTTMNDICRAAAPALKGGGSGSIRNRANSFSMSPAALAHTRRLKKLGDKAARDAGGSGNPCHRHQHQMLKQLRARRKWPSWHEGDVEHFTRR
jgi:hypothetical protein